MTLLLLFMACDKSLQDTGLDFASCSACSLIDPQNYGLDSEISAETWKLPAKTDVSVDWSELTLDMSGQSMVPEDVDRVVLVAFKDLTPAQIADGLAHDTLSQSDAALFMLCQPDGTNRCALSDFSILGSTLDIEEVFLADTGTWLVALTTQGQLGSRSMTFLQASTHADDELAVVENGSASLDIDVDLHSLQPLWLQEGVVPTVEWEALTRDGLGNTMQLSTLDELVVIQSPFTVKEAELRVLELESAAVQSWSLDIEGRDADLADLVGDTPFTGVDEVGTWWLGLRCSTCNHPAPRFLTRIDLAP